MRIILPILFGLFWISPASAAAPLRIASIHVTPSEIEFTCERSGLIIDTQTYDSIAQRYGLVGKADEINQKISNMQSVGYRIEGKRGHERFILRVPYRGVYRRSMKFGKMATLTEAHIYAELDGPSRGKLLSDDKVKQYLLEENRDKITKDHQSWTEQFDTELNALQRDMKNYIYSYPDSEKPELSRATRGTIKKPVPFTVCGNEYKVTLQVNWEHVINREPGK
jgi:hypothetical protein